MTPAPLAFSKYHALGNDYVVIDPTRHTFEPEARLIQALCDRHHGIGANGILLGPLPVPGDPQAFGFRMFNSDGSESEKSGNGLRIFARYLLESGHVTGETCRIHTASGFSEVRFLAPDGSLVEVNMGLPSFRAADIPYTAMGPKEDVLDALLFLPSGPVTITAVNIGNPHCILFPGTVSEAEARRLGPRIEKHPDFPHRVNVQLVEVLDRRRIRLEIWERGAGYTLASGSSSCAAAAACRRLNLVDDKVRVLMPGGEMDIAFSAAGHILMTGPVQAVFQGRMDPGWLP